MRASPDPTQLLLVIGSAQIASATTSTAQFDYSSRRRVVARISAQVRWSRRLCPSERCTRTRPPSHAWRTWAGTGAHGPSRAGGPCAHGREAGRLPGPAVHVGRSSHPTAGGGCSVSRLATRRPSSPPAKQLLQPRGTMFSRDGRRRALVCELRVHARRTTS